MAIITKEHCIEKDIPEIRRVDISDYKYSDNTLSVEFAGKIQNQPQFVKELMDLIIKYITPRTSDRE